MPGNLSWLAGLGAGLSNLGQNLNTQSLLEKEMQRQKALDALNTLVTLRNVGGTQLPSDVSPTQATQGALVSDLGNAPGLTATAAGMPTFAPAANAANTNPANPLNFGGPRTVQLPGPDGQPINILMDPSKTPEALQEQRMYKQQQLMTDRANQVEQQRVEAAQALEDQRAKTAADAAAATRQAAVDAATNKQKGDYATLKAEYGNDQLSKLAFDPNTDYTSALANARAVAMQNRALAASAQGDWAPTGAVDATTQEPILFNKKTGERMVMKGAMKPSGGGGGLSGGATLPQRIQQFGMALQSFGYGLPLAKDPGLGEGMLAARAANPGAMGEAANYFGVGADPNYMAYTDALAGGLMATAHSVGGARINKEQIQQFGQNMRVRAGDSKNPGLMDQKLGQVIGFLNAARAELPPDQVAKQEAQIPAAQMQFLRAHGYGQAPDPASVELLRSAMQPGVVLGGGVGGQKVTRAQWMAANPVGKNDTPQSYQARLNAAIASGQVMGNR